MNDTLRCVRRNTAQPSLALLASFALVHCAAAPMPDASTVDAPAPDTATDSATDANAAHDSSDTIDDAPSVLDATDTPADGPTSADVRDVSRDGVADDTGGDTGGDAGVGIGPVGVYIPEFQRSLAMNATLSSQITLPYVDGVFVSRTWSSVEPTNGAYVWSSIDADLRTLAALGKHATLGIGGGLSAASWVCSSTASGGAGATCLPMVYDPTTASGTSQCNNVNFPVPWDRNYLNAFESMIAALGAHIAGDPTLSATLVGIKLTGVNESNEETTVPDWHGGPASCSGGDACTSGMCTRSDALGMLTTAGYSDATMQATMTELAMSFHTAFPHIPVQTQISASLPNPGSDDIARLLDDTLAMSTIRPMTEQDQGLRACSGVDPGVADAHAMGLPVGFQEYLSVSADSTCADARACTGLGTTCDETVFRALVDYGISNHAQWLEIYSQDVAAYPTTTMYAHTMLPAP